MTPSGSATTVKWYTGNDGPGSPRSTAVARVDDSVTVQYGAQADEAAIRRQLQAIAVYGTFSTSPTGQYSGAQVTALSLRTTQALTPQPGQSYRLALRDDTYPSEPGRVKLSLAEAAGVSVTKRVVPSPSLQARSTIDPRCFCSARARRCAHQRPNGPALMW